MKDVMKLSRWARGIRIESRFDPNAFAFFWFYEWHLFDAVKRSEHTSGSWDWEWNVDEAGTSAFMSGEWLKLRMRTTENGAKLDLEITNSSAHDWPSLAAMIPCLNPGDPKKPSERNCLFLDERNLQTYFHGKDGLELIKGRFPREIHFNYQCRNALMAWNKEREDGKFVFDEKWPTSERDACGGLMVRESRDERYVMGIAWESFLSAQGHNPWNCMHLSIKVGPLERGKKKTIGGNIYLFEGSKEDCLRAFQKDYAK